jgi:hypothetical protein
MSLADSKILYHYILVRQDLPFSVQMVNVAHAAGESITTPIPSNTRAVLLHVKDEAQLLDCARLIEKKGLTHVLVREPDEPFNNSAMAIGLEPSNRRNMLRRLFYNLELVKEKQKKIQVVDVEWNLDS